MTFLASLQIRTKDGREHEIRFSVVVNCAGAWAADVAEMAKIGLGEEELMYPLPVEPRYSVIL